MTLLEKAKIERYRLYQNFFMDTVVQLLVVTI